MHANIVFWFGGHCCGRFNLFHDHSVAFFWKKQLKSDILIMTLLVLSIYLCKFWNATMRFGTHNIVHLSIAFLIGLFVFKMHLFQLTQGADIQRVLSTVSLISQCKIQFPKKKWLFVWRFLNEKKNVEIIYNWRYMYGNIQFPNMKWNMTAKLIFKPNALLETF